jgi:RimJ/RimL family protein N-acetyltransferase
MVRHLFAGGVGRLHAVVDARNAASIALVERLGFTRTRTFRSEDVIGGMCGFDHDYVLKAPRAAGIAVPKPEA